MEPRARIGNVGYGLKHRGRVLEPGGGLRHPGRNLLGERDEKKRHRDQEADHDEEHHQGCRSARGLPEGRAQPPEERPRDDGDDGGKKNRSEKGLKHHEAADRHYGHERNANDQVDAFAEADASSGGNPREALAGARQGTCCGLVRFCRLLFHVVSGIKLRVNASRGGCRAAAPSR